MILTAVYRSGKELQRFRIKEELYRLDEFDIQVLHLWVFAIAGQKRHEHLSDILIVVVISATSFWSEPHLALPSRSFHGYYRTKRSSSSSRCIRSMTVNFIHVALSEVVFFYLKTLQLAATVALS